MDNDRVSIRKEPLYARAKDRDLFKHELFKRYPPISFINVKNAIVSMEGVVFSAGTIITESLGFPQQADWFRQPYLTLNKIFFRCHSLDTQQRYLLVHDAWSAGYFHWMSETLCRIMAADTLLDSHTVILPSQNNSIYSRRSALGSIFKTKQAVKMTEGIHAESLQPFRLKNITYIKNNEYLKVPNLTIVSHLATTGNYNDNIVNALRQRYLSYFELIDRKNSPRRKLYISRRNASRRRVINEASVTDLLKKYNYQITTWERFCFRDQVTLASESDVLIGLHGAGLTNIMFMSSGTYLLELRVKGDKANNCYFSLASALKINYLYQECEKVSDADTQNADVLVDIQELAASLTRIERWLSGC